MPPKAQLACGPPASVEETAFFENRVRPLLAKHCWACHGAKKQEASLRLDASEFIVRGSDNGAVVVAGEPDKSPLVAAVLYEGDVQMPPAGRLPQAEIDALVAWVKNGAALAARIQSFETAFGMQMEAPEAFDLSRETDATLALYGLERGSTGGFAWQCLAARRLAERGVRFIELIDVGSSNNWDAHGDMETHVPLAKNVDRAIAGLLMDLKERGMLDDTLVIWTTEFGRTPYNAEPNHKGREHHHWAFSSWLAGGGVKPGVAYGATDEYGIHVADRPVHLHDFHATILHLMGLDHERLTFRHAGRDYRLTDVHGSVVREILA